MKRHPYFACLTILFIFFGLGPMGLAAEEPMPQAVSPGIAAESGIGDLVDKTETLKATFHPKLKRILNVENDEDIAYLKILNEEQQIDLANLIQSNIDSSSSQLLQRMATLSNFFPAFLLGKFAPQAGPEMAARLSYYVKPERNVAIAKHTKPEFLAESVYYLEPAKVVELMVATPEKMLVEVADIVAKKGDYYLMAEFADHLPLEKAKTLISSLNNAEVMLKVGYYMKNTKLLGDLIAAMPPEFVSRMIQEVIDMGYFEMSAKLSQRLDREAVMKLFEKVDPAHVAKVSMHYPPELLVGVMNSLSDEQVRLVLANLTGGKCAELMNEAPVSFINAFWLRLPPDRARESISHIDLNRLKSIWGELNPEVQGYFQQMKTMHAPLAEMLQSI